MAVLASRLDPASDAYQANRAANLDLLAELERLLEQARPELVGQMPEDDGFGELAEHGSLLVVH